MEAHFGFHDVSSIHLSLPFALSRVHIYTAVCLDSEMAVCFTLPNLWVWWIQLASPIYQNPVNCSFGLMRVRAWQHKSIREALRVTVENASEEPLVEKMYVVELWRQCRMCQGFLAMLFLLTTVCTSH